MQIDDAASILARADFFDICTEDELRLLAFASERLRYETGAVITHPGDVPAGAQVLIRGTVSIATGERGEVKPRVVSQPGAVIDTMALMVGKPRHVTVTAVTSVETLLVPRSSFLKLASQSPEFAQRAADRIRRDLVGFVSAVAPLSRKFRRD